MGVAVSTLGATMSEEFDNVAIDNFRKYLRIKTIQPNPDYEGCVKFLIEMANELGMTHKIFEVSLEGICLFNLSIKV